MLQFSARPGAPCMGMSCLLVALVVSGVSKLVEHEGDKEEREREEIIRRMGEEKNGKKENAKKEKHEKT